MRLARRAGIDAADARLIDSDGDAIALIRRFDRPAAGGRLMYVSAATMIGAEPGDAQEHDLRFGARDADGADKQPHLILLTGEYVLDARTNGRSFGIGTGRPPGHRLAPVLLAVKRLTRSIDFSHASLAWLR